MLRNLFLRSRNSTVNQLRHLSSQSLGRKQTDAFVELGVEDLRLPDQVQLKGRRFLPGADKDSFPEFLSGPRYGFPRALKANGDRSLDQWGKLCREEIDRELLMHPAIVFRGLPLSSIEDFQQLFASIDFPGMDYVGGSAHRQNIGAKVYSASDEPPECCIDLHNEMSYSPVFNKKVRSIHLILEDLLLKEDGRLSRPLCNLQLFTGGKAAL